MKKMILIGIFTLSLIQFANAQALLIILFGDKLSTETLQAGINADLSYSNFNGMEGTDYRVSWAFGAFFEIKLSENWSLQPELTIKTPGGAKNMPPEYYLEQNIIDTLTSDVTVTTSMNYISVPIYLKYTTGHWGFGGGPMFGYLTSATDTYSGGTAFGDEFSLDRKVKDRYNNWDVGLTFMIDFLFSPEEKMRSTRLGLKYYMGLTDILNDNTGDAVNNSIFLLSLGIPIGG
jgi:hypothetical protein